VCESGAVRGAEELIEDAVAIIGALIIVGAV